MLDKRVLTQTEEALYGSRGGGGLTRPSQRRFEAFLEQCRADVHALARLKHPCVLRLIAPLEETRTQLVFITEPVFASLADLLGGAAGDPAALAPQLASERRQLRLSGGCPPQLGCAELTGEDGVGLQGLPSLRWPCQLGWAHVRACRQYCCHALLLLSLLLLSLLLAELELKHGLLQLADGLHFLHSEAGLVHRGICPGSVLITQSGGEGAGGGWWGQPLLGVVNAAGNAAWCGCCFGCWTCCKTLWSGPASLCLRPTSLPRRCAPAAAVLPQAPGSWRGLPSLRPWTSAPLTRRLTTTVRGTPPCCSRSRRWVGLPAPWRHSGWNCWDTAAADG